MCPCTLIGHILKRFGHRNSISWECKNPPHLQLHLQLKLNRLIRPPSLPPSRQLSLLLQLKWLRRQPTLPPTQSLQLQLLLKLETQVDRQATKFTTNAIPITPNIVETSTARQSATPPPPITLSPFHLQIKPKLEHLVSQIQAQPLSPQLYL